jgi:5-methylcytosine-specific restriction endonuclease McrA
MSPQLEGSTLVLNRSWVVIHTTTVRRALTLAINRAAKIIAPDTFEVHDFESWSQLGVGHDDPVVRTVSLAIRVPEIIVLSSYDAVPKKKIPFTRRNIYKRDDFTCQYCGRRMASEELSIDHVLPRSRGGRTSWTNCVLSCIRCNVRKGNRTPEEAGLDLLVRPKQPRWEPTVTIPVGKRRVSWAKFVSERYWDAELTD